ncbi:hypothetical protein Tsubulata_024744 [Turnera subulata]|uniref:Nuclear transcription factor Y subunit n=1 Tax=Turnera subulata TaxID=218843 RepID=A0A9Q0FEQ9_9ROSI|nr:hypothetical protein Tsubulata_024744 [Turnera subulata]
MPLLTRLCRMPAKPGNGDNQLAQSVLQSSIYSQPWWRGVGNNPSFGESTSKSSSVPRSDSSFGNGAIQAPASPGLDTGANFSKDAQMGGASQSDGSNGQENHLKHVESSAAVLTGGNLEPNSQMELVGHSIVLTPSNPYMDPQYAGMFTSYGPPAMVPPQLYGMHHARMPLPLEMEEEPVYVNAKQFHGIMRRRQARAKAELEKKAIKVRKPYLHESRHQHAMRRARGCGGRFLNTKNQDNNADKQNSHNNVNSNQSSSLSGGTRDVHPSVSRKEGSGSMVQDMQGCTSSSGNGNVHGQSSPIYHPQSDDGKFLGQRKESTRGNGAIPSC